LNWYPAKGGPLISNAIVLGLVADRSGAAGCPESAAG
jgi:hypothetical protein